MLIAVQMVATIASIVELQPLKAILPTLYNDGTMKMAQQRGHNIEGTQAWHNEDSEHGTPKSVR
jgi:hypothetical protein